MEYRGIRYTLRAGIERGQWSVVIYPQGVETTGVKIFGARNDAEDHANPPELGTVERAMKRVQHGRYVLIPAGPNTHGHFSHFYAELWKPYLIEFMKTLGPPLAAAAE